MSTRTLTISVSPNLPLALDPPSCGCTECIVGEYKPLDQASREERLAMVLGHIRDNTGMSFLELHAWEQENCPEDLSFDLAAA